MLLQTKDWLNFRNIILDRDGHACTLCQRKEGPIFESIPEEEWKEEYEQIRKHNEDFEKTNKENPDLISQQLSDVTYEGLWAYPVNERSKGDVILHAHHKLYFFEKLPWEYPISNLSILCSECHSKIHATTIIFTYKDATKKFKKEEIPCQKCGGTGYIHEFYYFKNGICFDCGGIGLLDSGQQHWMES